MGADEETDPILGRLEGKYLAPMSLVTTVDRQGYDLKSASWEPEGNLAGSEELTDKFVEARNHIYECYIDHDYKSDGEEVAGKSRIFKGKLLTQSYMSTSCLMQTTGRWRTFLAPSWTSSRTRSSFWYVVYQEATVVHLMSVRLSGKDGRTSTTRGSRAAIFQTARKGDGRTMSPSTTSSTFGKSLAISSERNRMTEPTRKTRR